MKQFLHSMASMGMALLVLFSTVSFTVDKHFCGKILVDQAVFSEAKTCGMHTDHAGQTEQNDCCEEEKVLVEGQKELKTSFEKLDFEQQVFISSFAWSFITLFEEEVQEPAPFFRYKPPLLIYDIQLLDQTFLI